MQATRNFSRDKALVETVDEKRKAMAFLPSEDLFFYRVNQLLKGMLEGLNDYAGATRVACIIAPTAKSSFRILDPGNLLDERKYELGNYYKNRRNWQEQAIYKVPDAAVTFSKVDAPELENVIAVASNTKFLYHQCWFVEKHPRICCEGPIKRWLTQAAKTLYEQMLYRHEEISDLPYIATRQFAPAAIQSYLQGKFSSKATSERVMIKRSVVPDILQAVLKLTTLPEEGSLACGTIVFSDVDHIVFPKFHNETIEQLIVFDKENAPRINRLKHLRKLLTAVENDERHFLVANDRYVLGIGSGKIPPRAISVSFTKGVAEIRLGDQLICIAKAGKFSSISERPDLSLLQKLLQEREISIEPVFSIVQRVADSARKKKHGCAIVVDLGEDASQLRGHKLEKPEKINVNNIELMLGMAKVDGAIHIDQFGNLQSFGSLLDGAGTNNEDLSRGARYNSAIRFTNAYRDKIVVVVSEDGPVSVFSNGADLSRPPSMTKIRRKHYRELPTLKDWLT